MSDMKLYNILETFDNLESATDKLTPYVAEEPTTLADEMYRTYPELFSKHGDEYVMSLISDIESRGGSMEDVVKQLENPVDEDADGGAAERIHARVEARKGDGEVEESQTKVQTMGDKVKVTTDGNTTEFDDAETAAAMMGSETALDDENKFATESTEEDEVTEAVSDDDGDHAYDERKDKDLDDRYDDELAAKEKEEKEQLEEWAPAVSQDQDWGDWNDEDGTEFSTFDSENEAHRKRLQRGTPVVLSPALFKDGEQEVNRRGKFVNISSSGFRGKVIRDCDAQIVTVNLDDIVSADITNNSVYEQYNVDFDAMLAEDITMTQTTNMENPENDTTTVTAVGPDAGDELAAMMSNAGLAAPDAASPLAAGPVDQGEPAMAPTSGLEPLPMLPAEEPEELNASCGNVHEAEYVIEDHLKDLSPDIGLAIANGQDIYDVINSPETPQRDRDLLRAEYEEIYNELSSSEYALEPGHHPDDDFEAYEETAFEQMAQRIYDMYSKNSEDNDGGMFGRNPLDDFPELDFTSEETEERDITHANTPHEITAGVDMVTHGTSGGLNKPKQMFKKEYPGDNPMSIREDDSETDKSECKKCGKLYDPSLDECPACTPDEVSESNEIVCPHCEGEGPEDGVECKHCDGTGKVASIEEDNKFVNEHEDVDNFLSLYKEFSIRGEKK